MSGVTLSIYSKEKAKVQEEFFEAGKELIYKGLLRSGTSVSWEMGCVGILRTPISESRSGVPG
jgi:hypothetical protein